MANFKPERWLYPAGNGEMVFNADAGPMQQFGAGPRSCFGMKQAQLQLRIAFTLLVWNFELLPLPESLAASALLAVGKFYWPIGILISSRVLIDTCVDAGLHHPKHCYLRLKHCFE